MTGALAVACLIAGVASMYLSPPLSRYAGWLAVTAAMLWIYLVGGKLAASIAFWLGERRDARRRNASLRWR